MVRHKLLRADVQVAQQSQRDTSVLGRDDVHLTQSAHRAKRDVLQISDGRRHVIERARLDGRTCGHRQLIGRELC